MTRTRIAVWILLIFVGVVASGYCIRHGFGNEALDAWGAYLEGCATLILAGAAGFAGIQALQEYRTKIATEKAKIEADKAKWLFQLYHRLFEENQYKAVRRKLDYDDTSEIKALIAKDKKGEPFDPAEMVAFDEFTDYLNFFEMIAHLKEANQLSSPDIQATFDYYLRLLTKKKNPEIREYLKKDGFESLDKLLLQYEDKE